MMLHEIKKQYKTDIETQEEVWNLLNKHCKDALGTLPIVRGMGSMTNGYGIIHGAAGKRTSANTTNHYTVILDAVLPKDFPKRSASIICANWKNRHYANNYGTPYAIIPFDGVKIGVCPERDMFDTEVTLVRTQPIYRWNNFFSDRDISDKSFSQLVKDFKAYLDTHAMWGLEDKAKTLGDVKDILEEAYTKPFKLATTATAEIYNDGNEHEVWIGGKCIAIDIMLYRSVMRQGGWKQLPLKF